MLQLDFTLSHGLVPSEWCLNQFVTVSQAGAGRGTWRGRRCGEQHPAVHPELRAGWSSSGIGAFQHKHNPQLGCPALCFPPFSLGLLAGLVSGLELTDPSCPPPQCFCVAQMSSHRVCALCPGSAWLLVALPALEWRIHAQSHREVTSTWLAASVLFLLALSHMRPCFHSPPAPLLPPVAPLLWTLGPCRIGSVPGDAVSMAALTSISCA